MAEYTQNLDLEKPTENENFRRQVLNDNMEKIDAKFGTAGEGHNHDGTAGQGRRISFNSLEDKAHKSSHAIGGSDVITPADIGAETPAGAQAKADIVRGSIDTHLADTTKHVVKDGTLQTGLNADKLDGHDYSEVMPISGGAFTGIVTAQNNTSYTTKQVRNICISTSDPSGGNNGDIWIKYTP